MEKEETKLYEGKSVLFEYVYETQISQGKQIITRSSFEKIDNAEILYKSIYRSSRSGRSNEKKRRGQKDR